MDIFLGAMAGIGWASAIVATRIVISKSKIPDDIGAILSITAAGLTALIIAAFTMADFDFGWSRIDGIFITGIVSPGLSQITYFAAIRHIGPSRAGIVIGTAPVFSVLGAYFFSDGDLNAAIIFGTLVVIMGSALLTLEKTAEKLKFIGIFAGLFTSLSFGARDVVSDKVISDENLNSAFSAGILWLAGVPVILVYILARRGALGNLLSKRLNFQRNSSSSNQGSGVSGRFFKKSYLLIAFPGIIQGASLAMMLEAFKRGRVEIIAPFSNSFAAIGAVLLAFIILGKAEWNFRIGFSMSLVVAGAILVSSLG